jgi:hypothetical protein
MLRELINTQPDPTELIRSQLRYDYSLIPADKREQVQAAAVEIVRNGKRAQESLIEIGERLIEIKAVLEHGQFSDWCETEFALSQRMAQNMMNVAREFGGKNETVSLLTDSVLIALAAPSTPEAARVAVIEQAQAAGKSPTKTQVAAVIAGHKPNLGQMEDLIKTRPNLRVADLRSAARKRAGHWLYDTAAANAEAIWPGAWSQTTLVQALQGVADEMERATRPAPQPPVSPEQRQYESAARSLDSLDVVDAVTVRVADGKPNMDWEPEEWEDAQRKIQAAKPAPAPDAIPSDLAYYGWTLRQVPGSGRWYANNANGPRATQVFDTPDQAIQAAYQLQRNALAETTVARLAQAAQPQAPAEAPARQVIDPRTPVPADEADAFQMAADTMSRCTNVLRLARQYLNGYHDEAQAALDEIISNIETLIGDLRNE